MGDAYAFSLDISLLQENYSPGETFQAEIFALGNLDEGIVTDDLKVSCSGEFISIVPSMLKIGEGHYFTFFDLEDGLDLGNCSFIVQHVVYYEGGFLGLSDFSKEFSLVEANHSIISVFPASVFVEELYLDGDFDIYITNKFNESINFTLESSVDFVKLFESSLTVSPGEFGFFNVFVDFTSIETTEKEEVFINYGSERFVLPIWLFYNSTSVEGGPDIVEVSSLKFVMDVESIDVSLDKINNTYGYITVENDGIDLRNIIFSLTGNLSEVITLQSEESGYLVSGEIFKEYIYVNQRKDAVLGSYNGFLKAEFDTENIVFPIFVEITGDFENTIPVVNQTGNGTSNPVDEKEIGVWWYVGGFFVLLFVVVYFLYKKKTKKLGRQNYLNS